MRSLLLSLCCFLVTQTVVNAARPLPLKVEYSAEELAAAQKINHVIVIFQENWSFDGLYGKLRGVNGIANATAKNYTQVDKKGVAYSALPTCIMSHIKRPYPQIPANLPNAPFDLEPYIPTTKNTGDLAHEFYHEIAQIAGGRMNAFAAWSNAGGFVMSYYDISATRIGKIVQQYTICDNFFHSCYGSSMCNAIWLFSAQMPIWPHAPQSLIAEVGPDRTLIKGGKVSPDGYAIGDEQPFYPPYKRGANAQDRVPPQKFKTIGDLLSAENISWGWYAEGWNDAIAGRASHAFPFHHQAPSYFQQFAPTTQARKEHVFDLSAFYEQLDQGALPQVCFIRSLDFHSEHPGEGPLLPALTWCADLIERIQNSSAWSDCAIILTYDENGGRWDHVTPPEVDQFGPGTRIPTAIISPYAKKQFVDSTCYETVSVLKFIEQRWGLPSLSNRDAQANNLLNAFDFEQNK